MASEASINPSIDNSTISNATKLRSEQVLKYDRTDFFQAAGTGREVSVQGKETGNVTNEKVILSEETTGSYSSFMTDHFSQLLKQSEYGTMVPNPSGGEMPFQQYIEQYHPHEANVLKFITSESENGKTTVDQKKLATFLESSKGMMVATQLLEDVTAQKLFMLGLSGVKNNPDGNLQVANELHIKLGIDQGRLNLLADRMNINRETFIKAVGGTAGLASLAAGGAYLANQYFNGEPISGIDSTIAGAGAGIATGIGLVAINALKNSVGRGVASFRNEGVTIDLKRNLDGMRAIQQNPQEIAYLKAITGVDMNDFEIVDNAIRVKDASQRVAESTRDPAEVEGEILQGLYARNKFLQDLGINTSKINGSAEQRFMAGRKGSAPSLESEKMGTTWERMIQDEFKPNQGGIRDKFGRKPGEAFFGTNNDSKLFIKEVVGGATTFRDPLPAEQQEYKKNPNDPKFQLQSKRIFYLIENGVDLAGNRKTKLVEWNPNDRTQPKIGTPGVEFRMERNIDAVVNTVNLEATHLPGVLNPHDGYASLFSPDPKDTSKYIYNPDNLDTEGNLKRYSEARRKVIEKMANTFIVEEQESKAKKDQQAEEQRFSKQIVKASEIIDTRIATLQKPETQQQRETALNTETTALTTRNTEIDQRLQGLETNEEQNKKRQEIAIEIRTKFAIDVASIKDIEDKVEEWNDALETPGGLNENLKIAEGEVQTLLDGIKEKEKIYILSLPPNMQRVYQMPTYKEMRDSAERLHGNYAEISRKKSVAEDKIKALKEVQSRYLTTEVEIAKSNNEKLGSILPQIVGQEQSFDSLTNPAKVSTPIPEVDLSTLSIEDLSIKALALTDTSGSPLFTDKNVATQAVIKAKTEALVRSRIPTFSAYQKFMTELATNGIVDFEMKTVTEMTDRAEEPISAGGLGWNPADRTMNEQHITNVLKAYQNLNDPSTSVVRFRTSLELEKQYNQGRLKNIETEKVQIKDNIQQEITRLEAYKASLPNIKDVSDRQGELFSEVREELTQRIEQYVSQDLVDAADDKYTPAEKSTLHPKGYYEMLDLIFKYKDAPNREQVFTHLNKIMPPKKLALMLHQHLIMPSNVGNGPKTIKDDLVQMFKHIKANKNGFTAGDYRNAMGSIINDLREEARAFTKI